MGRLAEEIIACRVRPGGVRVWWLGQAGFALKTPEGRVTLVDPYLSDAVERLHGFKRLSLSPIEPDEARADLVVLTHEHADHLDPDAVPCIAAHNPACRFAAPAGCAEGLTLAGVDRRRRVLLRPHRTAQVEEWRVQAVPADHGDLSPTALSLVLQAQGVRLFVSGDSSWRPGLLEPLFDGGVDLALPCINGVFGNMNHIDAAMMVAQARPRLAVPCHFWTFAEQGAGDPGGFLHACHRLAPTVRALLLRPGEGLTVRRRTARRP